MRMKGKKVIFNRDDTYSLDETLRPIIAAGLHKFIETLRAQNADPENCTFGIPACFVEAEPDDPNYEDKLDEGVKEWFAVLEAMIYAFEADEPELDDGVLEMVSSNEPNEQGHYPVEIIVHDKVAHDKNKEDTKIHFEKVQKGLDLFAKHFQHLWW